MIRALICGSALALAAGFAVQAQEPASKPADPPEAAASAASATAKLKTGMTVKDSAGATVGKIASVGAATDASATVGLSVDGKTVEVPATTLSLNAKGDGAVSTQTKAEIKAAKAETKTEPK